MIVWLSSVADAGSPERLPGRLTRRPSFRGRIPADSRAGSAPAARAASSLTTDRMAKAEKLDCCHTRPSRLLLAMDENDRNLNAEQLRKCALYFRALAAVICLTPVCRGSHLCCSAFSEHPAVTTLNAGAQLGRDRPHDKGLLLILNVSRIHALSRPPSLQYS